MQKSKILKWALILGIVIVINMFSSYSLSLVYNAPEYEKFCPVKQVQPLIDTEKQCLDIGGQWNANLNSGPAVKDASMERGGYCDENFTCNKSFQSAESIYERNVFVTLIILGLLLIVISLFIKTVEVVALALSLGGLLSLIIASIRYWSLADNLLKVGILGIALISLIILAIKKFKD